MASLGGADGAEGMYAEFDAVVSNSLEEDQRDTAVEHLNEKLARIEDKLDAILRLINGYKEDEKREIIFKNRHVLEIYGCKTEEEFRELTGNSFNNMVHPDDFLKVQETINAQIASPESLGNDNVLYRIIRKDGQVRLVGDHGHFSHSPDYGDIFYVFISDVTMHHQ